ncbi:MAG: hypothetical protein P9X24_18400 [Candidatus Hatepunaea meridiana]|nr:hypothetical protein [Candidatus Hatepunaea meridiana]
MIKLKAIFILMALCASSAFAITGDVILETGAEPAFCEQVGERVTTVINAFESGDLARERGLFTDEGYRVTCRLLKETGLKNGRRTHRTNLIKLDRGGWEVRDIKVNVELGETAKNDVLAATDPTEYLVFELTDQGLIDYAGFSTARGHVKKLVEDGLRLKDAARRMKILQTVEVFRTAYCVKDIDYLKWIYSDDALIIVGKVLQPNEDLPDMLENSCLDKERIKFVKKSKADYIKGLESVFQNNAYVKVIFDSLDVLRHSADPDLYGVTLKQNWYSSSYSDTGWVFLLWDFKDEKKPLIYVRSWQPDKFEDGSILGLYDFKIERGTGDE